MRENKRKLQFKKIKIANMNLLRGGGETDPVHTAVTCPSDRTDCPPIPASDSDNPCSDDCMVINTGGEKPWLCIGRRETGL